MFYFTGKGLKCKMPKLDQGGKYSWTTHLDTIKRSIDWQLSALKTDYIDFGFLHCIDEESDQHPQRPYQKS